MTTPKQKLQVVVNAMPGECWHETTFCEAVGKPYVESDCKHCGTPAGFLNPSPDDMNALLKIAEKLGYYTSVRRSKLHNGKYAADLNTSKCIHTTLADTPASALLEALYQAKGGK